MEPERLTVLGVASLRYGPTICGGLACYFGEQPLEVHFWDPDPERLDLFDLFARYLFKLNKTPHLLRSYDDPHEALDSADRAIIALDEHGAMKYTNRPDVEWALSGVQHELPKLVLDLREDPTIPPLTEERIRALPHDIMRYLRGDDWAYEFLREQEDSPVKVWLQRGQR